MTTIDGVWGLGFRGSRMTTIDGVWGLGFRGSRMTPFDASTAGLSPRGGGGLVRGLWILINLSSAPRHQA